MPASKSAAYVKYISPPSRGAAPAARTAAKSTNASPASAETTAPSSAAPERVARRAPRADYRQDHPPHALVIARHAPTLHKRQARAISRRLTNYLRPILLERAAAALRAVLKRRKRLHVPFCIDVQARGAE